MKVEEFQKLLIEYSATTKNVRACSKPCYSGVCKMPDEIASKIGCIISFLQDKIDHGQFCKQDEFIMIYNFQPLHVTDTIYLCSLDMVVKPVNKINDLSAIEGTPLHLVVDGRNGKIVNNTYALMQMDMYDEEDEGTPECYGNYLDYLTPQTPYFKERLTALNSVRLTSVDSNGKSSETKVESESRNVQPVQKVVAFAFNLKLPVPNTPVLHADLSPASQAILDKSLMGSLGGEGNKTFGPIKCNC